MQMGLGEVWKPTLTKTIIYGRFFGRNTVVWCVCVLMLVLPLAGQGHAADGEAGGGDGPPTSHSGVSD